MAGDLFAFCSVVVVVVVVAGVVDVTVGCWFVVVKVVVCQFLSPCSTV
jgi:hypothetical protein